MLKKTPKYLFLMSLLLTVALTACAGGDPPLADVVDLTAPKPAPPNPPVLAETVDLPPIARKLPFADYLKSLTIDPKTGENRIDYSQLNEHLACLVCRGEVFEGAVFTPPTKAEMIRYEALIVRYGDPNSTPDKNYLVSRDFISIATEENFPPSTETDPIQLAAIKADEDAARLEFANAMRARIAQEWTSSAAKRSKLADEKNKAVEQARVAAENARATEQTRLAAQRAAAIEDQNKAEAAARARLADKIPLKPGLPSNYDKYFSAWGTNSNGEYKRLMNYLACLHGDKDHCSVPVAAMLKVSPSELKATVLQWESDTAKYKSALAEWKQRHPNGNY